MTFPPCAKSISHIHVSVRAEEVMDMKRMIIGQKISEGRRWTNNEDLFSLKTLNIITVLGLTKVYYIFLIISFNVDFSSFHCRIPCQI